MKAAILVRQREPLVIADIEIPKLDVGQVLVKVKCTSICGKQLDEISGKRREDPYLPHLLGHEGGGVVVEVGPGVRKVKPGDHVVLHWVKGSGIDSLPPKFHWNGSLVNAGWVTTFSEYSVVSENRITPIDPDVSLDVASLLGCAVTTGLGIVFNNADLKPGQSIALFGVGGVGLNVLQGASLVNAYPVVVIDLYDHKLKRSVSFGATHTVRVDGKVKERLLEISGSRGFDAVVDTTGDARVRELAYEVTSPTGKTVLAGVPSVNDSITIDSFPLHFGRRILGVHGGDTQPDIDIPRYLQLYRLGKLKLDQQITHRYPLDEINQAIDMMRRGEVGRCLIVIQ